MGKTIAEKILSSHSGKTLKAGELALCDVDACYADDVTGPMVIDSFLSLGKATLKDKDSSIIFMDHYSPSPDIRSATSHKKIRLFAQTQGARTRDVGSGLGSQLLAEEAALACGGLIAGAGDRDSTLGALNILSCAVTPDDIAVAMATGKVWLKVPETIKVIIKGKLPKGVYAYDAMLKVIHGIGARGASYKAIEICGDGLADMSIDARMTIAALASATGSKAVVLEADKKTVKWVQDRLKKAPDTVKADIDAKYAAVKELDLSGLTPMVAMPHSPDNARAVSEVKDVSIDAAFIGSSATGRIEDIEIVSKILKGNKVKDGVKFMIAPASRQIFLEALKRGLVSVITEAGACFVAPGTGQSEGTHNGVPADGDVCISADSSNRRGKMGNTNASIYLASPATVAASALTGKITDPCKFRKKI